MKWGGPRPEPQSVEAWLLALALVVIYCFACWLEAGHL